MPVLLLLALLLAPATLAAQDDGGRIAHGMRAYRAWTDLVLLDSTSQSARELRDGRVFEAAVEVAGDDDASPVARVFALRALVWAREPGRILEYPDLTGDPNGCAGLAPPPDFAYRQGEALPADYDARITALTARILADARTPTVVRRAAACVRSYRPGEALARVAPPAESDRGAGDGVRLVYLCGNRFVVESAYDVPTTVRYEVTGTGEASTLALPPRTEEAPRVRVEFATTRAGTVLLSHDGAVVGSVENGGRECAK